MADEMTEIKQNIWDNLQVEVTATFNPIKLPLKQVKEMEQGLVVEVGDLMDNRVSIEVEGHPVAFGELLVLGDKFGVRIQGLQAGVEYVEQVPPPSTVTATGSSGTTDQTGTQPAPQQVSDQDDEMMEEQSDELMDLDLDESDFDDLDEDDEDWT
jgi:hypothetical protein